ncbi:MAG: hypothetical protein E7813_07445 [Bradyrhizobium sp.]|uniref:hypothetical protein n=1 Tax=Bradyrhizobium sp. TaxID=376 RepID=UPI00120BC4EF|nr:hypothetical protein [Bradyrhizobium sp.]THD70675.1 MAG: hypothetical protein E7813_07445 [Bradyrhizobium sp.]
MSNRRKVTALAAGALLLSGLSLGGCATSSAGSSPMDARAQAPAAPKAGAYSPIQDKPPERDEPTMTTDERLKLRNELIAARDRQPKAAKVQKAPAQAEPAKP